MCPSCTAWFTEQLDFSSISDFLDTFDLPVIIFTDQAQIVAVNRQAEEAIGKPSSDIQGLLGGDAMECIYARLPEGCGNTAHCSACTIRKLIQKTLEQKQGQRHQIELAREHETIHFIAETHYINEIISIQLIRLN